MTRKTIAGQHIAGLRRFRRVHLMQPERDALRASYAAGPGRRPTEADYDDAKARLATFLAAQPESAATSE